MSGACIDIDCQACSAKIQGRFFSLCLAEQRNAPVDARTVETITSYAKALAHWCESCGLAPGLAQMAALGLTPREVIADPADPACGKCASRIVKLETTHLAYILSRDVDHGGALESEFLFEANLCPQCGPASSGFETLGAMQ